MARSYMVSLTQPIGLFIVLSYASPSEHYNILVVKSIWAYRPECTWKHRVCQTYISGLSSKEIATSNNWKTWAFVKLIAKVDPKMI